MNAKTVNPLFDDFLHLVILLALGLNYPFVPGWLRSCSLPLLLIVLAVSIFTEWKRKHLSQEEKRDMERAETDERNLMVREKAARFCQQVEFWLMLGAFWFSGAILRRHDIAYVFYWLMIIHWFLMLAARWWMNRKY